MLSGDEGRVLAGIERCLADDDPLFAVRLATGQRYMGLRAGVPFYRPLCVLVAAVVLGMVMALVAVMSDGAGGGVPEPSAPSTRIADDDRTMPLVEPR